MLDSLLEKTSADYDLFQNFRPVTNLKFVSKFVEKDDSVFIQLNEYLVRNELHEVIQSAYKSCHIAQRQLYYKGAERYLAVTGQKAIGNPHLLPLT